MEPAEALQHLFAGKTVEEQKALLAQLERGGAALYRSFAENESDPAKKEALLAAAVREEENADLLDGQLAD